jgi:hypothetical protein
MKPTQFLILILSFGFFQHSVAQSVSPAKHEIAVDLNYLLENTLYFPFGDQISLTQDLSYLLHYNNRKGNRIWRNGIGLRFSNTDQESSFDNQDLQTSSVELGFRTGLGRIWSIAPKWEAHVGGEVFVDYSRFETDYPDGLFSSMSTNWSAGAGPFASLYFVPHPRIAIWVETTLYGSYSGQKSETIYNDDYLEDVFYDSNSFRAQLRAPTTIYVSVLFGTQSEDQ